MDLTISNTYLSENETPNVSISNTPPISDMDVTRAYVSSALSSTINMGSNKPVENDPASDTIIQPSCTELKNIKYKMRLMNPLNNSDIKTNNNSYDKLQMFLDDEKNKNKLETWNKLNKSIKNKKMEEYINKYIIDNNYEEHDKEYMYVYLYTRINQGKLSKNKEVIYDKTTGTIKDIPGFIYNKNTKHVTIKNIDSKHVSTLKNLKTSFKSNITL